MLALAAVVLGLQRQEAVSQRQLAETNEARARGQEERARAHELEAQYSLAGAMEEKALRLLESRRHLEARIYAAASLVHNPANPGGPRHTAGFQRSHPHSRELLSSARSVVYQAGQHAALHSSSRHDAGFRLHFWSCSRGAWPTTDMWVVLADDGSVRVGDASGKIRRRLGDGTRMTAGAASTDGAWIAAGGQDGAVHVWSVSGTLARKLGGEPLKVRAPLFSRDPALLIAGYSDGMVRAWSVPDWKPVWRRRLVPPNLHAMARLPGSGVLAGQSLSVAGPRMGFLALGPGRRAERGPAPVLVGKCLAPSPDGRLLATAGTGKNTAHVWDLRAGRMAASLALRDEGHSISFSPDGSMLMTTANDGMLRIWDPRSFGMITAVRAHRGYFWGTFSPEGGRILTVGADRQVRIWKVRSSRLPSSLDGGHLGQDHGRLGRREAPGDQRTRGARSSSGT